MLRCHLFRSPNCSAGRLVVKLIIQIPCFNEEKTLPQTYADLPKEIDGIDQIEVMVIDDGSTDKTVRVARELGVDHIIRHGGNRGLAATFSTGIRACLQRDADIIVNTDGDNQYCGPDITRLVIPLLRGEATIVLGDRQTSKVAHFSIPKKLLQRVGSMVVRKLSGTNLNDAVSGFRAFSREAALQLNVITTFSYTVETLIQAGAKRLPITSVPIRTNPKTRDSRLFKSVGQFVSRQVATMFRSYMMYHPARVFLAVAVGLACCSMVPLGFLFGGFWPNAAASVAGYIAFGAFLVASLTAGLLALTADLQRNNRRLIEMVLESVRQIECGDSPAYPLVPSSSSVFSRRTPGRRQSVHDPGSGVTGAN